MGIVENNGGGEDKDHCFSRHYSKQKFARARARARARTKAVVDPRQTGVEMPETH